MNKIDMHCHVSNRFIQDVVDGDATINNLLIYMKKHNIEKTILLATYFPHKGSGISNFRLYDWIKNYEEFSMFGSLDFEYYFMQGYNELEEMLNRKLIKGIKIYTCYQNIDEDRLKRVCGLANYNKVPIMFHTGYSYSSWRKYKKITVATPYSAASLVSLIEKFPDVNFILSHLSKPFFNEIIMVCKKFSNVYTDMSGLIDSIEGEDEIPLCIDQIRMFLDHCSHKQLLFGTDFPVQTHEHSIKFIESLGLSNNIRKDIYYNNAVKLLYGVSYGFKR